MRSMISGRFILALKKHPEQTANKLWRGGRGGVVRLFSMCIFEYVEFWQEKRVENRYFQTAKDHNLFTTIMHWIIIKLLLLFVYHS